MSVSKTIVKMPAEDELPISVTVDALLDEVFRDIKVPFGAKSDAFQHPPAQLGKDTSTETVPAPVEVIKKLSLSVEEWSWPFCCALLSRDVAAAAVSFGSASAFSKPATKSPFKV